MNQWRKTGDLSRIMLSLILLVMAGGTSGCIPKVVRSINYPPLPKPESDAPATTVSIQDVTCSITPFNQYSEMPDGASVLHERLGEQLNARNLTTVVDDTGAYTFHGTVSVIESRKVNGLVVPAVMITVALLPIGAFIGMALPINTVELMVTADVILSETSNAEELLHKTFNYNTSNRVNGYQNGESPNQTINRNLANAADVVLKEIADESAQVISERERKRRGVQ